MAGIRLDVALKGGGAAERALGALEGRLDDMTPLADEIGAMLVASIQHRFETGIGVGGKRWKPSQRVLRESGQTLVDERNLEGSITRRAGPEEVVVGSNIVYARIHQLGGRAGRNYATKLPARPYIGIDFEDEIEIAAIANDYLFEATQ